MPTEGDSVWPHDVISHQGKAVRSVQPAPLDFGLLAPVRPIHEAEEGKERSEGGKQ